MWSTRLVQRVAGAGTLALALASGSIITQGMWNGEPGGRSVAQVFAAAGPALASPGQGATLESFGPTLTWTNPAGATQVHLQVLPANNDGPGIDVYLGSAATSYAILPPPQWYGLLPGMSYTWKVRVSDAPGGVPLDHPSWSPWAERTFRTPSVTAATVAPAAPVPGGFVTSMTPILQWSNSRSDIFYYELQLSKDQTFTTDPSKAIAMVYEALLHGGVTSPPNSYAIPRDFPLEPNSVYYWRVRPRVQGDGTPVPWGPAQIFRTVTPNPQVLFAGIREGASQGFDLIIANADGSNVRNLTNRPFDDRSPSWSPDRKRIVFETGRDNELETIYVMNADGSGERRLSPPGKRAFNPSWSPDGEKIAFELETGPTGADIVVIRPDGSGMVNVSNNPAAAEHQPGWSPNSTHLVYTQWSDNGLTSALYVVAADGSGKRKLTAADNVQEDLASWSPDGSRIAYILNDRTTIEGAELYVVNADGSNPRQMAKKVIADWPVQWSPDGGARLLYVAPAGGSESRSVWVINADGSNPRNLSGENPWTEDTPFWSPDGTRISFTSNRADLEGSGGQHLYLMNADGSGKVRAGDFKTSVAARDAGIWPPM